MADPSAYTYPSPLAGYEDAVPLPSEIAEDGKSYVNPQTGVLSSSYESFTEPLDNGIRGALYVYHHPSEAIVSLLIRCFSDIHIYYFQKNASQKQFAKELWQRIRYECK